MSDEVLCDGTLRNKRIVVEALGFNHGVDLRMNLGSGRVWTDLYEQPVQRCAVYNKERRTGKCAACRVCDELRGKIPLALAVGEVPRS